MAKYNRFFVIVMDSLGIGHAIDQNKFFQRDNVSDLGANTFGHIAEKMDLDIPTMESLGIGDLDEIKGVKTVEHPNSFSVKLNEASNGKDTMTGHREMMGILTTKPFKTFTEKGFPKELIDELTRETGHKIIGNYASSGTVILDDLGEQSIKENILIVYTSSDSVLQICASEETLGLDELYRCCEIARRLCMKPEYLVGRVIARPFIGKKRGEFKRTSNRHDYTVSPTGITALDILKHNGYDVKAVGKINDIFNGVGITSTVHTVSNQDGMDKTIEIANDQSFKRGLCFVNLVEFDSEFGHRRNVLGYGKAIEEFDVRLKDLIRVLKEDDVVMVTADHGNDPTRDGTDHTREKVPLLVYSKKIDDGRYLGDRQSFAMIGATILDNFSLKKDDTMIGEPLNEILK
jgi:phosphopentomutase